MSLVRDKLLQLQRIAPKATRFGQLYAKKEETKQAFKRVLLYTLFVSDEGDFLIRDHLFEGESHRTPKDWHDWFARAAPTRVGVPPPLKGESNLEYIQRTCVLPGISTKTGLKDWSVESLIGWRGDVKHKSRRSAVDRKRNKTKPKRRKNG